MGKIIIDTQLHNDEKGTTVRVEHTLGVGVQLTVDEGDDESTGSVWIEESDWHRLIGIN